MLYNKKIRITRKPKNTTKQLFPKECPLENRQIWHSSSNTNDFSSLLHIQHVTVYKTSYPNEQHQHRNYYNVQGKKKLNRPITTIGAVRCSTVSHSLTTRNCPRMHILQTTPTTPNATIRQTATCTKSWFSYRWFWNFSRWRSFAGRWTLGSFISL